MANYTVKICNKEVEIKKTASRAIKAYCTDCSAGSRVEIAECPSTQCPLYPFRGYVKWEGEKREMSEEQKQVARDRFAKIRAKNTEK